MVSCGIFFFFLKYGKVWCALLALNKLEACRSAGKNACALTGSLKNISCGLQSWKKFAYRNFKPDCLLQPFIVRYHCVMQSLVELTGTKFTEKMLFEKSLRIAISLRCGKIRNRYSSEAICITTDLVRNILQALCSLEVVTKCVSV